MVLPDAFRRVVLPVVAVDRTSTWHCLGTAFVVARADGRTAFLLTAAHVIKAAIDIAAPRPLHHPTTPDFLRVHDERRVSLNHLSIVTVLVEPGPTACAEVEHAWMLDAHDVALILARIPETQEPRFVGGLGVDPSPVEVGTQLEVVGYPGMRAESLPDDELRDNAILTLPLTHRSTTVTEKFPHGYGINRWPGFKVDIPLESGMSGGPFLEVRDGSAIVRGLVNSDLTEATDLGAAAMGQMAFGSTLWPALGTPMDMSGLTIRFGSDETRLPIASFLDLFRYGAIMDYGETLEHFRMIPAGAEHQISWQGAAPDSAP